MKGIYYEIHITNIVVLTKKDLETQEKLEKGTIYCFNP